MGSKLKSTRKPAAKLVGQRSSSLLLTTLLLGGGVFLGTGCGSGNDAAISGRLWVSGVPTSPRQNVSAFVMRNQGNAAFGVFFFGSAYRGQHDVFRYQAKGRSAGSLKYLADGESHDLRIKNCKPTLGFDHCIVLSGDPERAGRYQSRKRWGIGKGAGAVNVQMVLGELANEDPSLAPWATQFAEGNSEDE